MPFTSQSPGISIKDLKLLFEEVLIARGIRSSAQYLSKDTEIQLTFPANTPKDTEAYVEITPPDGYYLAIRYFTVTTPVEVKANILLTGIDGVETRMLKDDQAENLSDQMYDAGDWDKYFFFLQKFRLYGLVTGYDPTVPANNPVTTADRTIVLKFSGSLVKIVSV